MNVWPSLQPPRAELLRWRRFDGFLIPVRVQVVVVVVVLVVVVVEEWSQ